MKIIDRSIGPVMIVELLGDILPQDIEAIQALSDKYLQGSATCRFGLFNFLEVFDLKPALLSRIMKHATRFEKSAILTRLPSTGRDLPEKPLNVAVLRDLAQGIKFFETELSGAELPEGEKERLKARKFERLRVSIPVHVQYEDDDGHEYNYEMFTVNVSEGGMLARFLDLQTAWSFFHHFDEYDLPLMRIRLDFPLGQTIEMHAKIVGKDDYDAFVRMEFYNSTADGSSIKKLITEYRSEKPYAA